MIPFFREKNHTERLHITQRLFYFPRKLIKIPRNDDAWFRIPVPALPTPSTLRLTHHVIYTRSQTSYSINSSPRSPLEHFNGVIIDGSIVDLRNKLTAKQWRRRWWFAVYGIIDLMCCTSRWCRRNRALEHRGCRIASCRPCRRGRRWGIRSREQLLRHRKLKWDEKELCSNIHQAWRWRILFTFLCCFSAERRCHVRGKHVLCWRLRAAIDHPDGEGVEGVGTSWVVCTVAMVAHNGSWTCGGKIRGNYYFSSETFR